MTPSVEILIGVSLICLSPFLLVVWTQREQLRYLISGKKEEETKKLDADYQQAQALLIECRKELHESGAKERSLKARVEKATAQIERAEKRLEKAPKDAAAKARLSERIANHKRAEHDLKHQIAETKRLRVQKFELESEVQRLYSLKEFAKTRSHYVAHSMRVEKMFLKLDVLQDQTNKVMDEIAAKIALREADSSVYGPVNNPMDDVVIEQTERFMSKVAALGKTFDSIRVLAEIADPSVEHAYQRLCGELDKARQQAHKSLREEENLEEQVARLQNEAELWHVRAENAGINRDMQLMAVQRKGHHEEAAAELSEATKIHRRKNFSIQQTLFRVDGVLRRLYVIKLLLSPLSGEIRDELTEFRQIVDAVYSYLSNAMQRSDEPDSPSLDARIANLEHRCITAYIRIAKQETQLETSRHLDLLRSIPEISELIDTCIVEQTQEIQRWESCLADAARKEQGFTVAVATQRRDDRAAILKTMEQSREVLLITNSMLAEQKRA